MEPTAQKSRVRAKYFLTVARPSSPDDPLKLVVDMVALAHEKDGSDIHLRAGSFPAMRIAGDLVRMEQFPRLTAEYMESLLGAVLSDADLERLHSNLQVDSSLGFIDLGRVRINTYYQRGSIAMAMRIVKTQIPTMESLGLPPIVKTMPRITQGLVLAVGATSQGKSTTLASLIDDINHRDSRHIVTIEDPIEFLFKDDKAYFSQRDVGIDTHSFSEAMTAALREDPDVILLSDLRDRQTIDFALTAAETGHLVFGTVHAPTATDTVTRIVAEFPPDAQLTVRAKLSQNLKAVVAQRLLPRADGKGRVLACEVLTVTPRVRELILDPTKVEQISEMVRSSRIVDGMLAFDQQIFELLQAGTITTETALRFASSPNDMQLKIQGFKE